MYQKDRVTIDIFDSVEKMFTKLEDDLADIEKQRLLNYATWYLELIEGELGITEKAETLEERREDVRLHLLTRGKVCIENVTKICKKYAEYADVKYSAETYKMQVVLNGDIPEADLAKLKDQLRAYVPAHILIGYSVYARTHGEMQEYTHEYLHNYTHGEITEKAEL
jgi:hypothetical protein